MNAVRWAWIFCVLGLLFMGPPAWAQWEGAAAGDDLSPHSEAELVSEVAWVQPGAPFTVALRLEMEEGWHSYWKNPGDAGGPTTIDWALPEGFAADSIQWPYPHRIEAEPLVSYGYSDEVFLLTEITPPDDLEPGTSVTLEGLAEWLVCADICLPAEADISLALPVRAEAPAPGEEQEAIAATREKLPKALAGWEVRATRSSGSYALEITPPEERETLEGAYFFPAKKAVLAHAAPQPVSKEGNTFLMALQQSEYAQAPAERLRGILVAPEGQTWDAEGNVRAMRVDVPVEAERTDVAAAENEASMTLLWALFFAFVGGLILNLMPCVFPILSVKILGFVRQADHTDAEIRRHGLVFGGGVLVSFWVLAGALLALRAAGDQIGWGFQLQSPIFVALMTMLFFVIGLSLLGVFEVGASLMNWGGRVQGAAPESSYRGSFLSGVLATIVATPCTAPFMGAALGFALMTLSAFSALLVFTALGAGMAAPYVALSMAPRLLKRLPDPGAWMETLKQALAFPMFATAVWLVWVFGQQTGPSGMALLLFGLLLLGVAVWILGRWSVHQISTRLRFFTRGLATLGIVGALAAGLIAASYEAPDAGTNASGETADWQAFSSEKVEELRAQGRPVFVDFTAAWCLTCQVNERTALSATAVREAFKEKNVALLKADWTNRDPEITRALEAHDRSGVPLYVLYKGDGSEPILLPEILTRDIVLGALEALPDPSDVAAQMEDSNRSPSD